jgi:hypothetical protein
MGKQPVAYKKNTGWYWRDGTGGYTSRGTKVATGGTLMPSTQESTGRGWGGWGRGWVGGGGDKGG